MIINRQIVLTIYYVGATKSAYDIGFATFGGPVGLGVGIGYFGLDMLGAFNGGPAYSGPPAPFSAPDATGVRW